MRGFDILLAVAGLAGTIVLLCLLIRRRLLPEFPFFLLYVTASITFIIVKISVSGSYRTFFIVSWTAETIYVLLAILALHEVFRKVFAAFYEKRWFWLFFPIVVICISVLAVIYRLGSPPAQ